MFVKNFTTKDSLQELQILLIATQKLGLPAATRSLCFYFYHRLQVLESETKTLSRLATVVNLSMKINENVRKFKEIYQIMSDLLGEKDEYAKIKDEMMILELLLQENTGFLQDFDSPFRFLLLMVKDLNLSREIGKKSWKITLFSLFTPLCVQVVPQAIAFSCIYLAVVLSREKLDLSQTLLDKYYISQDQVFIGLKVILKLLLNKKFQDNYKIGFSQDLLLENLHSIEKSGLQNPGLMQVYSPQNMENSKKLQGNGQNQGFSAQNRSNYGKNQGYRYGHPQNHGNSSHASLLERKGDARFSMAMKYDKRNFTPAPGMGLGPSGAAATHGGDGDHRQSSSAPSNHSSDPKKRRHSEKYEPWETRESIPRDSDKRKRQSSTDSHSDDYYDRDQRDRDHETDRRADRYGRDYERRSEHHDHRDYKLDNRNHRRKSYDHAISDHRRNDYDQGNSRYDNNGHRRESRHSRDDRYSNSRRDGTQYQGHSYYSKR